MSQEDDPGGLGCALAVGWVVAVVVAVLMLSFGWWPISLVVLAIGALTHVTLVRQTAREREARAAELARELAERRDWIASLPAASVRLGAQGRVGVKGEWYRLDAVERVVAGRSLARVGEWEAGLPETAFLAREPANRHDPNAVAVLMDGPSGREHVGYLPAELTSRWQPTMKTLEGADVLGAASARIYAGNRDGIEVVLHLAEPEQALFCNAEPPDALPLPPSRQCAVTGENAFQENLAHLPGGLLWATLAGGVVPSGKYKGQPTIDVFIDDKMVGRLSATQGQRYAEVLGYAPRVCCEAVVAQGARNLEVTIFLPKVD